jgi:hypothetical protein
MDHPAKTKAVLPAAKDDTERAKTTATADFLRGMKQEKQEQANWNSKMRGFFAALRMTVGEGAASGGLVGEGAAVGSHFAGGGVDAVGAVHRGFDGFVAAEASVGGAEGPA